MRTVKGRYDGKAVSLDEDIPVDHEVAVLVTFLDAPESSSIRELLLSGPVWDDDEIAEIEHFIEEFRRWRA